MTNLNKLIATVSKVLGHEMSKEIYRNAVGLIYIATQQGYVDTRGLASIEIALCHKIGVDPISVSIKYDNIKRCVPVDDIIFYYGIKSDFEICISDYNTNIIKFKKKCYEEVYIPCSDREYGPECNELDDNSDFDIDDIEF